MGERGAERHVPSWAVTKLRPPELRDDIRARPRLCDIFDQAIEAKDPLVLVSAPVGSGKSTAVASWVATRSDLPNLWMQVDTGDNDPTRFWTALITCLTPIDQRIQTTVQPLLQNPALEFAIDVLPALVNVLDDTGRAVIVLDDYHLITRQQIHDDLALLIEAAPNDTTFVVSSRQDPPLHLGRLRVRGRLCEIRATDLRFDVNEAALILGESTLSASEVHTLCERTEGWAAGLVLASISLARSPDPAAFVANFAGDNRMVFDYLSTELWDALDEPVRRFFLDISVLDKMCGAVVDAILDTTDQGAVWLEQASKDNQLIISLDDHGEWYRFHHLLQGQLRSRLQRVDPDRYRALHKKAGRWFAQHDDPHAAIQHALAGGDMTSAARLIATHGSSTFSQGQLGTVREWLGSLGQAAVDREPWLAVLHVWTLVIGGEWEMAREPIRVAHKLLHSDDAGPNAARLQGSLAAARALAALARGDLVDAAAQIQTAVDQRDSSTSCVVQGIHGVCLTWRGKHDRATEALEAAVSTAVTQDEHLVVATALGFLSINACARDDHGRAKHLAEQSIAQAREHGLSEYHHAAVAQSILGRTLALTEPTQAIQATERGLVLARRSRQPIMTAFALISLAEVQIAVHSHDEASVLLIEARNLLERCSEPGMVLTFLARTETRLGRPGRSRTGATVNIDGLTDRELTIVRLLPSQLSVREISAELYVSHNTVKGHLKAIYRKLDVHDRQTAVQRARELTLL